MTPREVIDLATEREARIVDVRFVDLPGVWHHFSMPVSVLTEETFEEGIGFDGSSIRGFQKINESDMLLIPDPDTAFMDPFTDVATMNIICDVEDPITRERYSRDPRNVAKKAEAYLKASGVADVAYFGPEAEFYIFNDVRYDTTPHSGYYFLDSDEGIWNSGRDEKPNLGYKIRYKGGYFPVPPSDSLQDLRSEMMLTLIESGVASEIQHHEVGTAGQSEIDIKYGPLVQTADNLMKFKYIIKNTAVQNGYTVTFMPKPFTRTTARACTATSRCGSPARMSSSTRRGTPGSRRPPSTTSAAS
jgi:glutamine synthetase